MTDRLTYAERDALLLAVRDYAKTQSEMFSDAYYIGMIHAILTDEQVRDLFRMTQQ